MVRDTSIEAYHRIEAEGLLSARRWQVYSTLFECGPATGGEVFQAMLKKFGPRVPTNSNTITRLGELREMGVVSELGTRECSVSGQRVLVWDVTSKLPVKLEKKESKLQEALARIKELEAELSTYRTAAKLCKHGNAVPCAECFHEEVLR